MIADPVSCKGEGRSPSPSAASTNAPTGVSMSRTAPTSLGSRGDEPATNSQPSTPPPSAVRANQPSAVRPGSAQRVSVQRTGVAGVPGKYEPAAQLPRVHLVWLERHQRG